MTADHEKKEFRVSTKDGSLSGLLERAATALALVVTVAYISGFLISNTYLGTYHLALGPGELLKAKYIYVGFLFLAFMVLVASLFRLLFLWLQHIFNRKRVSSARLLRDQQLMISASEILDRRSSDEYQRRRVRSDELRGQSVVALIASVLIIQALVLNPNSQKSILFVNLLFFVSVTVYQLTFYGELLIPYAKGLVFGRRFISDIRLNLFLYAQIPTATAILLKKSLPENMHMHLWQSILWGVGIFLIAIATVVCVCGVNAVAASSQQLKAIDEVPGFNPNVWLKELKENADQGKVGAARFYPRWMLFGYFFDQSRTGVMRWLMLANKVMILIVMVCLAELLCWLGIQDPHLIEIAQVATFLNLTMIALVFGNVVTILLLFRRRAEKLKRDKHERQKAANHPSESQKIADGLQAQAEEILLSKNERYFRRGLILMALYVTSIFSFSLIIYPHIPVQKAGGDFTKAPHICIRLNRRTKYRDCPPSLLPKRNPDDAFIELDEDDHFIYVANDHDRGGPSAWVWAQARSATHSVCEVSNEERTEVMSNGSVKRNQGGGLFCRPDIYAVSRECISGLMHFDPEDFSPNDKTDRCEAFEESDPTKPAPSSNHIGPRLLSF